MWGPAAAARPVSPWKARQLQRDWDQVRGRGLTQALAPCPPTVTVIPPLGGSHEACWKLVVHALRESPPGPADKVRHPACGPESGICLKGPRGQLCFWPDLPGYGELWGAKKGLHGGELGANRVVQNVPRGGGDKNVLEVVENLLGGDTALGLQKADVGRKGSEECSGQKARPRQRYRGVFAQSAQRPPCACDSCPSRDPVWGRK